MTTPTKSEIYGKAKELWFQDQHRNGCNELAQVNPEYSELLEAGYVSEAQSMLMSNPETLYGIIEQKKAKCENVEIDNSLNPYSIKEIMAYGCFVQGGRGSGKTNLLKLLVAKALSEKVEVKVIDPSLAWKDFPLPIIKVAQQEIEDVQRKFNAIYDVSRLSVLEARQFVSDMLSKDLQEAIALTDLGKKPKCLVVIEEAQNIMPSNTLRLLKFQDVSRYVSQGRNFGLSFIASTQRLARCDIDLVEVSGIKYFFRTSGHRNLSKIRWWISKYETWNLRNLRVGECYLTVEGKVKLLRLPLFEPRQKVIA